MEKAVVPAWAREVMSAAVAGRMCMFCWGLGEREKGDGGKGVLYQGGGTA